MTRAADAIVIGGGIHGCSVALHLARLGRRVIVLERRYCGRHASGVNAGGVRTLGRALAEVPLAVESMRVWHSISEFLGDDCGFHSHGFIRVAESESQVEGLAARREQVRSLGFEHEELIGKQELRRLVPAIAPHCVGGLISRGDGAADPYRTSRAFKRAAEAAGATVIENEGVAAIERAGERWRVTGALGSYVAPHVVNCAGAWGGRIAALIGDAAPLGVRPSMMTVTERLPHFIDPVIGSAGRKLSFKQTPEGSVLIGGGQPGIVDLEREESRVVAENLARSAQAALALFPAIRHARIVRTWCGIEAQMPDDIPVIGPSPNAPGVIHAFGFSGHGFQLGPIVGRLLAELVTRGSTSLPIRAFDLARFAPALAARKALPVH